MLSKAEFDIRGASQPRYHLEMALLRWIHLRKLVPLTELLGGVGASSPTVRRPAPSPSASAGQRLRTDARRVKTGPALRTESRAGGSASRAAGPPLSRPGLTSQDPAPGGSEKPAPPAAAVATGEGGRDAFLLEIRKSKAAFYNTVVAQAQKIEFGPERVTFSFLPAHRMLREQLETNRQWLEPDRIGDSGQTHDGRRGAGGRGSRASGGSRRRRCHKPRPPDLKTTAMGDSAVQAMLDVFPAEIENVEEIE